MRGKANMFFYCMGVRRITPAYAGKSGIELNADSVSGDHPCVCGEKSLIAGNKSGGIGSPLRMRGKDHR